MNNKYALVKFVDEEFELSVNVSPKETGLFKVHILLSIMMNIYN